MLPGEFYHLFNHANGNENLFVETKNYDFFLEKLTKYTSPICRLFSYCLMPNHLHLVIQIRYKEELCNLWKTPATLSELTEKQLELKTSKSFANLFSSYTQAFNKTYHRRGSLFIPSMKMKLITDAQGICKVIHYTHSNPVHHGFTKGIADWPHSSYHALIKTTPTKLEREYVLDLFGGLKAFIKYHEQPIDKK